MADTYDWETMLNELLEKEDGIAPYELEFLENLDQRFRGGPLSDKQFNWLEKIWQRLN